MTDAAPVLELRDVVVTAGGMPLLVGVSLAAARGESIALRGPSGCGKTTLLRAVAGLDDAAAGAVLLDGRAPAAHGWTAFRRTVVLTAQAAVMLPGTVRDNLARPFAYRVAREPFPDGRAHELLDALGIGARRMEQDARTLSVGQMQRVGLLRALLVAPRVLLLDEPTSGLDEDARDLVEDVLATERERGVVLLVVTHDAAQATRVASRVLDLRAHAAEAARAH